jgi:hypothetical protein
MVTIGINSFVLRQTESSPFSYFKGNWAQLAGIVPNYMHEAKPGYRDGVILVPVPALGFFSGVVEMEPNRPTKVLFEGRTQEEAPFIQVLVRGPKTPAKHVEIVLYRHDVLAEDGSHAGDFDWEIVSINARATEEPEPLTPMAMARNMAGLPGGTKAAYTAEEFVKSVLYWSTRGMSY